MVTMCGRGRRLGSVAVALPLLTIWLYAAGCERLAGIHSSTKGNRDGAADSSDTAPAGDGGGDSRADAVVTGDGALSDGPADMPADRPADGSGGQGNDADPTDGSALDRAAPLDATSTNDGAAGGDASDAGGADGPLCGVDPSVGSPIRATAFRFGSGPNNSSDLNAKGQCSFPNGQLAKGMFYGAVEPALYAIAARCGTCMRVLAGGIVVTVQVIDAVQALPNAHGATISIDQGAQEILSPAGGNPDVQFSFVPCPVTGNIRVSFQGALDPAVVVMGHRNELKSVQLVTAGTTLNMTRQSYNVWTPVGTFGGGRVTLLLTDVFGNVVRTPALALDTAFTDTGQQFPACPN